MAPPTDADLVVVGAGIVGLATARAVLSRRPTLDVVVLDKEPRLAAHQSSHNSGVVHAGIYYRPDSLKAQLVAEGRRQLEAYVTERGLPYERCGKVVVATRPAELDRLAELRHRAAAHQVEATWLDRRGLADHEPHVEGLAALHVPATGVVDFAAVCAELHTDVVAAGGDVRLARELVAVQPEPDGIGLEVGAGRTELRCRVLVTCAGLQADLVADLAGVLPPGLRIAPFRGEYHELAPHADHLVRRLVYPVPDPRFPFLGVHLTRGIDHRVHVGPNAVPALAREGYTWSDRDLDEVRRWLGTTASHRLARRYWRDGLTEIVRSRSPRRFLRVAQRLVPDLRAGDLVVGGSGVRAQALGADGALLDDFAFGESPRVVAVLNAPSPAATASLAIGAHVAERALAKLAP